MNLSDWRRRIDEMDRKLVELLNERSQCALEVGKLKQQAKMPLYQPDRENEVLEMRRATTGARLPMQRSAVFLNESLTKLAPRSGLRCIHDEEEKQEENRR